MRHVRAVHAALLVALSGCQARPPPDLVSSSGVRFYLQGAAWSLADIEAQERWFLQGLETLERYPRGSAVKAMSAVEVWVFSDAIPCSTSPSGRCNGLQNYNVISVRDLGCPFDSAYTHEVAHWLQQRLHGFDDYAHVEVDLWKVADSAPRGCSDERARRWGRRAGAMAGGEATP